MIGYQLRIFLAHRERTLKRRVGEFTGAIDTLTKANGAHESHDITKHARCIDIGDQQP
jgi:hypothetical protein